MSTSSESKSERGESIGAPLGPRGITPGGHPLDTSLPAFPVYHRKIGDPGPLGLSAFATTTFVLSLINIGAAGVTTPNVVASLALAYGGLCQLLAGMWEFASGNTFGATVFTSYGGFWISYGILISPWSGIIAAYKDDVVQLEHAIGFYLLSWFIFTLIIGAASLRSSIALVVAVFTLNFAFMLLGIAKFMINPATALALTKAGGYIGLIVAFIAWYIAAATLVTPDTSYFTLPIGSLAKKD